MKTSTIIFSAAGVLIIGGCIISAAAIGLGAFKTDEAVMKTENISTDNINKISVDLSSDNIEINSKNIDNIKITYYERETESYKISSKNKTLLINQVNFGNRISWYNWYEHIQFIPDDTTVLKIEIPEKLISDTYLHTSYGDIYADNLNGTLDISADFGDINVDGGNITKLKCDADYGNINISNLLNTEIKAECNSGDINFENILGNSLDFENNFGDVDGSIAANKSDYSIDAETDFGDSNISNQTGGKYNLKVEVDSGDISIDFTE